MSWYNEQLEDRVLTTSPGKRKACHAADSLASPLGKLGLKSPRPKAAPRHSQPSVATPLGNMQISSPAARLRSATQHQAGARTLFTQDEQPGNAFDAASGQGKSPQASQASCEEPSQSAGDAAADSVDAVNRLEPADRPLVVVIEGTESISSRLLQDLILVLSEVSQCPWDLLS